MDYRVRPATLDDVEVLCRHRIAMFRDMGVTFDAAALHDAFAAWLATTMLNGSYRAWLVASPDGAIAAGGGATIIPWPPGPQYQGTTLAFVYNVYTEPAHRRRGLGRLVMEALHAWCSANGVTSVALNASRDGLPLYESLGYAVSPNPMMFFALPGV